MYENMNFQNNEIEDLYYNFLFLYNILQVIIVTIAG